MLDFGIWGFWVLLVSADTRWFLDRFLVAWKVFVTSPLVFIFSHVCLLVLDSVYMFEYWRITLGNISPS